ncbi:MAG: RNA pseudouridine synthase, partial [Elusimicrobia bacterium]|nr:RNA pseudouridine synthase [Elusimicrobiota bacterium]
MIAPTLYEDERVLVVDKPAGSLVIAGRGEDAGTPLVESLSAE